MHAYIYFHSVCHALYQLIFNRHIQLIFILPLTSSNRQVTVSKSQKKSKLQNTKYWVIVLFLTILFNVIFFQYLSRILNETKVIHNETYNLLFVYLFPVISSNLQVTVSKSPTTPAASWVIWCRTAKLLGPLRHRVEPKFSLKWAPPLIGGNWKLEGILTTGICVFRRFRFLCSGVLSSCYV